MRFYNEGGVTSELTKNGFGRVPKPMVSGKGNVLFFYITYEHKFTCGKFLFLNFELVLIC